MTVRALHALFLLIVLGACGAPGSDAVFTKGNPKIARTDSIARTARPAKAQEPPKAYKGLYRRVGGESRFQPCGTAQPIPVDGSRNAQYVLRERFRWNTVLEGQKMFGVFTGWIIHDTVRAEGDGVGDSTSKGIPRTRIYMLEVDSLRPWNDSDCPGMKVPR